MSESKIREQQQKVANSPKSHQLSFVNITLEGNASIAVYCIHEAAEVRRKYKEALLESGLFEVETGDMAPLARDTVITVRVDKILVLAVATINHVSVLM